MAKAVYKDQAVEAKLVQLTRKTATVDENELNALGIFLDRDPSTWFDQDTPTLEEQYHYFTKHRQYGWAGRALNSLIERTNSYRMQLRREMPQRYIVITDIPELFKNNPIYHLVIPYTPHADNVAEVVEKIYIYLIQPEITGILVDLRTNSIDIVLLDFLIEASTSTQKRMKFGQALIAANGPSVYELVKTKCNDSFRNNILLQAPPQFPIELYMVMALTNCNIACKMCMLSVKKVTEKSIMTMELFQKAIDNVPHDLDMKISITPFTEPLIIPRFLDYVRYAVTQRPKCKVCFNTNGSMMDEAKCREIVDIGPHNVHVSLNTTNREDYKWFCDRDYFDQVCENVRTLRRVRDEAGKEFPRITLQVIDMPRTKREYPEFAAKWGQIVDNMHLATLDDNGGAVEIDERVREGATPPAELRANTLCAGPWMSIAVNWDGDIFVCCPGAFQDLKGSHVHLGNVAHDSIADVWQSHRRKWLRGSQLLETNSTCAHCNYKGREEEGSLRNEEAVLRHASSYVVENTENRSTCQTDLGVSDLLK